MAQMERGEREVSKQVVCVSPDTNLRDAARLMREKHIGDVVVIEKRDGISRPVGVVTDRDLAVETFGQGIQGDDLSVADIMMQSAAVAHQDDDLFTMIRLMKDNGVARLPIVNAEGAITGIITAKRLFQKLVNGMNDLLAISEQQQENERAVRH